MLVYQTFGLDLLRSHHRADTYFSGFFPYSPEASDILERNQVFGREKALFDIHQKAKAQNFVGTDDASLAEWMGIPVYVIQGEETNIKITTAGDMEFLKFYLENKK